ncbi:MAG: adenine phosphoribosyltransferase [Gemmatimonadetes bacterium]|nr:adenine phosphoribosyltransferase [Gemmatimonadota bacterium]|tara:strand:- start:652 stop:1170 length:519 start_codon:yes stop_codon:yes gene_type:complete
MVEVQHLIRDVPDFPEKGIIFKDISPLLANGPALEMVIEAMAKPYTDSKVEQVVGIESRGFIFGMGIALSLGCGFIPVRKTGKLPYKTLSQTYDLEYGTDTVEIHVDALEAGQRVLVVDDVLATGGTMQATCQLLHKLNVSIIGVSFLMELNFLRGREKLSTVKSITSLLTY